MPPAGINLVDNGLMVHAFGPKIGTDASATDWISLKDALAVEVVIFALNTITVTGSAVTLEQAQAVAGTNSKALAFERHYSNVDPVNTAALTRVNTTSNTFTTATTANAFVQYRIPVDPASLDKANGFDCLRVALANAVNATISAFYHYVPRYAGNALTHPNPVVD